MTSKERAKLRSIAMTTDPIFQIGKDGVTDNMVEQLDLAIEKRELIKVSVLKASPVTAKEALSELAERLGAEPVTAVGSKLVLYRKSKSDKVKHIEF